MSASLDADIYDVLDRVEDYLVDLSDVVDGPDGRPQPNKAMRLKAEVSDVLLRLAARGPVCTMDERTVAVGQAVEEALAAGRAAFAATSRDRP